MGVPGAAVDFRNSSWPEGIHGAKTDETVGLPGNLGRRPVVVPADSLMFVGNRGLVRIRQRVGGGENNGARDTSLVHESDQFVGSDALPPGDGNPPARGLYRCWW